MSHILEEYSKSLGVKTTKPFVQEHFYPVPDDRYIVLFPEHKTQSKYYEHYGSVLNILKPTLEENNIKVYQFGGEIISGVDRLFDVTFKNCAYLISRAMLYLGADNQFSHYASSKDVKTITIFGNCYAENTKPLWGSNKSNHVNIEPVWDKKPCFSSQDASKQISTIKPENISSNVLELCGLDSSAINIKTKNIGNHYYKNIIEVVPTEITPITTPKEIFLRVDYGFDEDVFLHYCLNHKVTIVTDKLIQPNILQRFSGNVDKVLYTVDKSLDTIPQKYFDILKNLGIQIILLSEHKEELGYLRNKYFDVPVHLRKEEKEKVECSPDSKFLSNKKIIQGDKVYLSYAHFKKGLDSNDNVLDTPDYWEELEHFYIYEQKESSKESNKESRG